jgi:hypothetical protein
MGKVKSKRNASGKTEKKQGTNQRKQRKVAETSEESSSHDRSTDERDPKQNVVAAMNCVIGIITPLVIY